MFIRVLVHYTVLMRLRNIVLVDGHEWPWRKFALSEHFLVYNIGANTKLYAKSCLSLIIYDMIYDISFHKVDEQASAKLKCIKFSEDAAKCVILSSRDIKTQILETETHVGANSNVMCPTSSYKLSYRREAARCFVLRANTRSVSLPTPPAFDASVRGVPVGKSPSRLA